jgi:hypothetical protein
VKISSYSGVGILLLLLPFGRSSAIRGHAAVQLSIGFSYCFKMQVFSSTVSNFALEVFSKIFVLAQDGISPQLKFVDITSGVHLYD